MNNLDVSSNIPHSHLHSSIQRRHSQVSSPRIPFKSKYLPQYRSTQAHKAFEFSLTFKNCCRKLLRYLVDLFLSSQGTSFPSPLNHLNNSIFCRLYSGRSLKTSVSPTTFVSCPRNLLTVGQLQYCSLSMCLPCFKAVSKAYLFPGSGPSHGWGKVS